VFFAPSPMKMETCPSGPVTGPVYMQEGFNGFPARPGSSGVPAIFSASFLGRIAHASSTANVISGCALGDESSLGSGVMTAVGAHVGGAVAPHRPPALAARGHTTG